jgi:hypothetical protein
MTAKLAKIEARLALIDEILEQAFFCPLHVNDWLGFAFGQPALMSLEEEELLDIFVRAAIATETIHPELTEGRLPLAWLGSLDDPRPVLAQVLASLRHDRPLLFHRVLFSLPGLGREGAGPEDFELIEDFLQKALEGGLDLSGEAGAELELIRRRALKAAGQDPERLDPRLTGLARQVLAKEEAQVCRNEADLRLWLRLGSGLEGVDEALAPAVLVEAWALFCGAVTGARPDLDILGLWLPQLGLDAQELALYAPVERGAGHVIEAVCPYCTGQARLRLGEEVKQLSGCPHLIYVGTGDEVHLLEVLGSFDLGADFKALLASYYQSPADLDLYSTIINDLYEMIQDQGRLETRPVGCATAPHAFYNLRAYFAGPPQPESTRH